MNENRINEILNISLLKEKIILNKNECLFAEGEDVKGVYIVISGYVKILKTVSHGAKIMLHVSNAGEILGLSSVIDKCRHTYSAIALSDIISYMIPRYEFLNILKKNEYIKLGVMKMLCSSIDLVENKICEWYDKSTTERLANTLIYLIKTFGTDKDNFIDLELPTKDLADMIGVSKEYLSQKIFEFKKTGLISSSSGKIRILDTVHLEEIAGIDTHQDEIS